jgi:hypothetical protein
MFRPGNFPGLNIAGNIFSQRSMNPFLYKCKRDAQASSDQGADVIFWRNENTCSWQHICGDFSA